MNEKGEIILASNDYVLAMYDIRSKQKFIYECSSVKEIKGASLIIKDVYKDYLYENAKALSNGKGIFGAGEDQTKLPPFSRDEFANHIKDGYIAEVVYEGGGNYILLFRDKAVFQELNYAFTKAVMENVGTLQILTSFIEGVDFDDYQSDIQKLYAQHRIDEGEQGFMSPYGTLPVVQVDPASSEPIVYKGKAGGKLDVEASRSSKAKLDKYQEWYEHRTKENGGKEDELTFDNIVEERGVESLLAVVYIDGNNMGAKVQACIKDLETYEDCLLKLRSFSADLQKKYIDEPQQKMNQYLEEKYGDEAKHRYLVLSGDEITFICNARRAYELIRVYFDNLKDDENGGHRTACAGAAIFHSHAPYAEAYRIAEECCESGKIYMRNNKINDADFMDFQYCQGAIGTSLEEIRDEEVGDLISKPWLCREFEKDGEGAEAVKKACSIDDVEKCRECFRMTDRTNVKGLAEAAKKGEYEYRLEIERINAHMTDGKWEDDQMNFLISHRALVYDIVVVYDIWFADESDKTGKDVKAQERKGGENNE